MWPMCVCLAVQLYLKLSPTDFVVTSHPHYCRQWELCFKAVQNILSLYRSWMIFVIDRWSRPLARSCATDAVGLLNRILFALSWSVQEEVHLSQSLKITTIAHAWVMSLIRAETRYPVALYALIGINRMQIQTLRTLLLNLSQLSLLHSSHLCDEVVLVKPNKSI